MQRHRAAEIIYLYAGVIVYLMHGAPTPDSGVQRYWGVAALAVVISLLFIMPTPIATFAQGRFSKSLGPLGPAGSSSSLSSAMGEANAHAGLARVVGSVSPQGMRPAAGFGAPVQVSTTTTTVANGGPPQAPSDNAVVVEDSTGKIYTVWSANTTGGIWRIYFSSSANGVTFTTPITVDATHTATTADVDPDVAVSGSGATAKVAVVYLHMTGYTGEGSYALYLSTNGGSSFTESGTSSSDTTYSNILDPSDSWDSAGNILIGFWECDTNVVTTCPAFSVSDLAVDSWTGGTTFASSHEYVPFGTGTYYLGTGTDFACYPTSSDCALEATLSNNGGTSMYVNLYYSTNDFASTSWSNHRLATGASNSGTTSTVMGAAVTHGEIAFSSSTAAVATYEVNTGTTSAPVYNVGVAYTSNSWTTATAASSPQGSTLTTTTEATIAVGASGTPVVSWVDASGNIQTTWSLTYPTTGWTFFSSIPVEAGSSTAVAATTAVSPFRYDYVYTDSSATPQVYYTNFTGLSAKASGSPTSVNVGQQVNFTSSPSGGQLAYTYGWNFVGACGSCVTNVQNPSVNYTGAGTNAVTVTITDGIGESVTASAGTITVTGGVTITSVALSPTTPTVTTSGTQGFTATPTCSATCPGTITYVWSLTNAAMGTITGTGASVTFNAGTTLGTVGIYVNATLGAVTVGSSTVITISAVAPTLNSVALSPTTPSIAAGSKQTFTAIPTCSSTCPAGITYVWSVTSTALGSLSGTGTVVNFTAGSTAGTVGVYVNATLSAVTKGASTVLTVTVTPITLTSIGLSPTGPSVPASGTQPFTATPSCSATCPASGIAYVWSLTSSALGTISGTGASVTFNAASTAGTGGIYVNATLNSTTKGASTLITVTPPPATLTSVALSPLGPSVPSSTTKVFTATPTCSSSCPGTGITYSWSVSNSALGSVSGTGASVTFTAGSLAVTGGIFVNATLNANTAGASTVITVTVTPVVTLNSVALTPTTPTVASGKAQQFTATPTCSATCPGTITYAWILSSTALGSLTPSTTTATFNAGTTAGTVGIFVNATLSGTMKGSSTEITVTATPVTLTGLTLSPPTPSVSASSATPFTASPTCTGGVTCSGVSYLWAISSSSLGSISGSGNSVSFAAGSVAGTVGIFVNASLSGTTKEASTVITVTVTPPVVTLTSVAVSPLNPTLNSGDKQAFTATPTCSAQCPSEVTYQWSLTGNDGNISATSGSTVTFTAGNSSAIVTLKVVATLGSGSQNAQASITVKASSNNNNNNGTSTPFPWWILVVVLAIVVVVMLLFMERRRRDRKKLADQAPPGLEMAGAAAAVPAAEEGAPAPEALGADAMVAAGLGGGALPDMSSETPTPPPSEGEALSLPQCPQCGNPMGPDRICYTCGVGWAPAETTGEAPPEPQTETPFATSEEPMPAAPPPLTQCPQCGNQLGDDMVCLTCGVSWSPDTSAPPPEGMTGPAPESPPEVPPPPPEESPAEPSPESGSGSEPAQESAVTAESPPEVQVPPETAPASLEGSEPSPPAPPLAEEPKEAPEEPKQAETAIPEAGTDITPETPVPEAAEAPVPPPAEEAPSPDVETRPATSGRVCFICGGELEGDYCSVCNMHWDTPA